MDIRQVAEQFVLEGSLEQVVPYGNGHINDTYLVTTKSGAEEKRYILQRINTSIFSKPEVLMENIIGSKANSKNIAPFFGSYLDMFASLLLLDSTDDKIIVTAFWQKNKAFLL